MVSRHMLTDQRGLLLDLPWYVMIDYHVQVHTWGLLVVMLLVASLLFVGGLPIFCESEGQNIKKYTKMAEEFCGILKFPWARPSMLISTAALDFKMR